MATYLLKINNPTNDNQKKISGRIDTTTSQGTGMLEGLPNPYTNELTNQQISKSSITRDYGNSSTDDETFANEILNSLISEVMSIYNINLTGLLIKELKLEFEKENMISSTQSQITSNQEPVPENIRDINSTVLLKVKSHTPLSSSSTTNNGQIIGETEVSFYGGIAEFGKLQFSDPGTYVISVIPSSQLLKETEFTIIVNSEEEFIEQDSKESKESVTGDRPIIAQIDETGIKLNPINFDTGNNTDAVQISDTYGFTPVIWYNGSQIDNKDVQLFELYNDGLIPKAKLIFQDTFGIIQSPEGRALSDTKFEVFINSGTDLLKSIHLRFKLEKQKDKRAGKVEILGTIDLDGFYKVESKSYKGTSFEVLRGIASELKLGFNSNITNTNDSMTWRKNFVDKNDFIRKVVNHSYISDDSFVNGYIDYYWCFNYVDVEKEWKRDISSDIGLNTQGVQRLKSTDEEKVTKLELLNDKSSNDSSFYFSRYELKNSSTSKIINEGTYTVSKVYDRGKKQFLKFDIDSITSTGDDKHILKGAPGNTNQMDNYRTDYSGKMDTDNVHENYHYAVSQNARNMNNLTSVKVDLYLPQPNYNLYRYLKLKINFINPKETETNKKQYDERLSGEWIIMDIRFIYSGGSLQQKVTAVRKEFGKTKEEINSQIVKTDEKDNSEINENPAPPTDNRPNEEYIIGETYIVEDNNGIRYQLIVDELLFNGVDIRGTIKRI